MTAEITVLSAGAVQPGLVKVIDAFRRETGDEVKVTFATAPTIRKLLSSGEIADVLIAPPELLDELEKTAPSTTLDRNVLGRIGVGVAVRDGAPMPKIATVDEFKQSLLSADSLFTDAALVKQGKVECVGVAPRCSRRWLADRQRSDLALRDL
jgi:molybdate transport system substrate-binding protein